MRLKILIAATLAVTLTLSVSAEARTVPCQKVCTAQLASTQHVKHWRPKGPVGEGWLLYLNLYERGERLGYKRLAGGCDASYANADVSAVLHACGTKSILDYVAFRGSPTLRVEYRYVPR